MNKDNKLKRKNKDSVSLEKVAILTSLVFIGTLVSMILIFFSRLIIARYWDESDFGIFSLAFSILSIFTILSSLGLKQGITRSIAFSRGKKDFKKINSYISTTVIASLVVSLLIGIFIFVFSENISLFFFNEPGLIAPLRVVSISIPFLTIIEVIISIYRGFEQVKPGIIYHQILLNILFVVFLVLVIILNVSFINVFYAYLASLIITFIFLANYATQKTTYKQILKIKELFSSEAKELILFSLPLLGTAMLQLIVVWTDILMLGFLKTSADVGLYTVSHNVAFFLSFPISVFMVIYLPISSGLYAMKRFDEIKINYLIITKWICSMATPLFIFFFLFPEPTIEYLYGTNYVLATDALRILSLGLIINNFAGPCGATLLSMGKSKFIMYTTLATAVLNIVLNLILIPIYGIVGAAIASAASLFITNMIKLLKLYGLSGAQPISKNLVKPTLITLLLILVPYSIFQKTRIVRWEILIFLLVSFYLIYVLVFLVSKSLDKEDLNLLDMIGTKSSGNIQKIKGFLSRFV